MTRQAMGRVVALCLTGWLATATTTAAATTELVWRPEGRAAEWQPEGAEGIYCWWDLWFGLEPGRYRVVGKLRAVEEGTFQLQFSRLSDGAPLATLGARIAATPELRDYEFGEFVYDGSYPLRISDWNASRFRLNELRLECLEPVATPVTACFDADGDDAAAGLVMKRSRVEKAAEAKIGDGALAVTVDAREGAPWEHGIAVPLRLERCNTFSCWIKWESEPRALYIQLWSAGEYGVVIVEPNRYGATVGEWTLLELPVKAFTVTPAADRSELHGVSGVLIGCHPQPEPVRFLIDDLLLEMLE